MGFLKFHPSFSGKRDSGKNLKKVLALVLAFACAFTMFAGAAFTDSADIKVDTEVVDTLVSLGVVNGYDDGSFKPNGTVTRAEMAKMIYVLRTGNSDASAYNDDKTSFTDIGSHWARGYIKYCKSLGIIAGKSNTKFAPNDKVTAQEAAKMLLVTLGYNADKAGLVGTGWASKTNALADENGLLEDVNTSFTSACPRQYAAQLIYNTIFAHTVTLRDGEYTNMNLLGTDKLETVGEKYMSMKKWVGTFEGNEDVCGLDTGLIRVYGTPDGKDVAKANADFKFSKLNLSYIGEEVSVLYKDATGGTANKPDKKDTIYGVYVTGTTKVYNITKDDLQSQKDDGTVRFGDKNYDVAKIAKDDEYINYNYGAKKDTAAAAMTADQVADDMISKLKATSADTVKFICNDDGDIVKAYVVESNLARVTAVNTEKVSINNGVGTIKFEDNDIYDGVKKDDIVVVTTLYNTKATNSAAKSIVTKAATVEGKLTSFKGTSKVSIDGTSYDIASLATTAVDSDFETSFKDQIGETYTLYTIGGLVYAAKQTSEGTKNYAIVEDTNDSQTIDSGFDPLEVKILKADGSEGKFVVHKDSTSQGTTKLKTSDVKTGVLIKYSNVSDNKIKITEVQGSTALNKDTTVYVKDTKSFNNKVAASDAVVFVNKTNTYGKPGDFYAYTIRNLNDIKAKSGAAVASILDDNKVVAAYVELTTKPSGSTADTVYGIVSKENGTVKDGDTTYTSYTVDVDTNTQKTVLIEGDSDTTLKEGYLVSFDEASDKVYSASDITIYLKNENTDYHKPSTMAAIDEYDEKGQIVSYWDKTNDIGDKAKLITKAVDDDVKIIYVSCDDDKAADNNGAIEYDGVKGTKNAYIVFEDNNSTKNVVAIFVDVDGDITK